MMVFKVVKPLEVGGTLEVAAALIVGVLFVAIGDLVAAGVLEVIVISLIAVETLLVISLAVVAASVVIALAVVMMPMLSRLTGKFQQM